MTIPELARHLNYSTSHIYRCIKSGQLNPADPASIAAFRDRTPKPAAGRPPKYKVNYKDGDK